MNYSLSQKASEDLENIWLYSVENWSAEQADRYYNLLIDEIEYITEHFDSGRSMDHFRKGYYTSKVKSHIIFYKKSSSNVVEIIRILHQNMDIETRLND